MVWTYSTSVKMLDGSKTVSASELTEEIIDKTLAPVDPIEVLGVRIEYVADSTVGTRALGMQLLDAGGDVLSDRRFHADTDLTASQSEELELAIGDTTAFVTAAGGNPHRLGIGGRMFISSNQKLRIYADGTTGSTDDLLIHVQGVQRAPRPKGGVTTLAV